MENPIINNRIVNDITFAVRLFSFIENIEVNDAMNEEEKKYILMIAQKLINYQKFTVELNSDEDKYLKALKI